jgi:hypothetical protein
MSIPQAIGIEVRNITFKNRRFKFRKAMGKLADALELPVRIYKAGPRKEHKPEPYLYNIQQQLSDQWVNFYGNILKDVYLVVTASLGLPVVTVETMQKAIDDGILRYKGGILKFIPFYRGKVLYSPETGQPIQKKEFDALIAAIEKFLNRKTAGTGEKIILDAVAISKILRRMAKYQTSKDMEKLTMETLKYRGKTFDWIRESIKHIQEAFRINGVELSRNEMARQDKQ